MASKPGTHMSKGLAIGVKGTATMLTQILKGQVSVTVAALAAATEADVSVTITGAKVGDSVQINPADASMETGLLIAGCWVSAADTVKIRMYNQQAASALTGSTHNWDYIVISAL